MGSLINLNHRVEDDWIKLDDDAAIDHHRVVVSPGRLQSDWTRLKQSPAKIGVELEASDSIEAISKYLKRLDLVILRFDSFADGRAFSQARLLRERLGYTGTLRASGEVLRDQLAFMRRCGFDQFLLADSEAVDQALGAFSDISRNYQSDMRHSSL